MTMSRTSEGFALLAPDTSVEFAPVGPSFLHRKILAIWSEFERYEILTPVRHALGA